MYLTSPSSALTPSYLRTYRPCCQKWKGMREGEGGFGKNGAFSHIIFIYIQIWQSKANAARYTDRMPVRNGRNEGSFLDWGWLQRPGGQTLLYVVSYDKFLPSTPKTQVVYSILHRWCYVRRGCAGITVDISIAKHHFYHQQWRGTWRRRAPAISEEGLGYWIFLTS